MRYYSGKEIELLDRLAIKNGLQVRQMMELAGFQMLKRCIHCALKAIDIPPLIQVIVRTLVTSKSNIPEEQKRF